MYFVEFSIISAANLMIFLQKTKAFIYFGIYSIPYIAFRAQEV